MLVSVSTMVWMQVYMPKMSPEVDQNDNLVLMFLSFESKLYFCSFAFGHYWA